MAPIAEVGAKDSKKPENEKGEVTIYFGIFFDGTNNHRLQVMLGKMYRSKSALTKFKKWVNKHNISPKNVYAARRLAKDAGLSDKQIEDLFPEVNANDFSVDDATDIIEDCQNQISVLDESIASGFAHDSSVVFRNSLQEELNMIKEFKDAKKQDFFGEGKWNEIDPKEYGKWNETAIINPKVKEYKQSTLLGFGQQDVQTNDYTNIALLETLYQAKNELGPEEYAYRIYVEGCGTDRDITEGESIIGKATGKWSKTGVVQKVTDAINAIKLKLVHFSNAKKVSIKYHIFGFSRGAAEARILANILSKNTTTKELVNTITKCKIKSGENVKLIDNQDTVKIQFVGLFDTVSSIGISLGIDYKLLKFKLKDDYKNNIKEFGLNVLANTDDVDKIFHICAMDEYRSNFALTPVPKCNKLLEIYLPGDHSDIGGGHSVGFHKSGFVIRRDQKIVGLPEYPTKQDSNILPINKENLENLGWYKSKEMKGDEPKNDEIVTIEFVLERDTFTEKRTLGKLYVNGEFLCDTLEDKDRKLETAGLNAKIPKETAIPKGRYKMELKPTTVKGWENEEIPLLYGTEPFFKRIRIHSGNTEKHTDGCILVGMRTANNTLRESRDKVWEIIKIFKDNKGAEFWITVKAKNENNPIIVKQTKESFMTDNIVVSDESILINRYSKKGYNYIPLHLMLDYANEEIDGIFKANLKFAVPKDLQTIYNHINQNYKKRQVWIDNKQYKWLRQNYLHFSSQILSSQAYSLHIPIVDGILQMVKANEIINYIVNRPNVEISKVNEGYEYIRKRYE